MLHRNCPDRLLRAIAIRARRQRRSRHRYRCGRHTVDFAEVCRRAETSRVFGRSRLSGFNLPRETAGLAGGRPHGLDGGGKALYRLSGSQRSTSELRWLRSNQKRNDRVMVSPRRRRGACGVLRWMGFPDRPTARNGGDLLLVGSLRSPSARVMDKRAACIVGRRRPRDAPHLGQGANQAIEDGVALAVLVEGRDPDEIPNILQRYEKFRRARTDAIQAEARKTGLRYHFKYENLEQRDREIANSGAFRKSLYDYDVEKAAVAHATAG